VSRVDRVYIHSRHNAKDRSLGVGRDTIRYDTIEEFNVDSKAEYTA